MALQMKDNIITIIGYNQLIRCVTDTGTHDSTHKDRKKPMQTYKFTYPNTHAHTRTHNTIPLGYLWPKSSMNPSLLAPPDLFSLSLSFWQRIGTSYIHLWFFFSFNFTWTEVHMFQKTMNIFFISPRRYSRWCNWNKFSNSNFSFIPGHSVVQAVNNVVPLHLFLLFQKHLDLCTVSLFSPLSPRLPPHVEEQVFRRERAGGATEG